MKNLTIILTVILFSISTVYSQIEVDANGHAGIIGSPDTYYELKIEGKTNIAGTDDDYPDLMISNGQKGYSSVVHITGESYYSSILKVSGITNNGYTFSVNGTAFCLGGQWSGSDGRLKKNITRINSTEILPKLMKISGKKYNYKTYSELKELNTNGKMMHFGDSTQIPRLPQGKTFGLIAQELELEFPELVRTDSLTQLKAINYNGMIPILLSAIQEQQNVIKNQSNEIATLQNDLASLKNDCCNKNNTKSKNSNSEDLLKSSEAELFQNHPNPFTDVTEISFMLPESINTAQLYIYNMNGTQLKSIEITERGHGQLIIAGAELQAGMYLYTLIVDGIEIDTKRMILTK